VDLILALATVKGVSTSEYGYSVVVASGVLNVSFDDKVLVIGVDDGVELISLEGSTIGTPDAVEEVLTVAENNDVADSVFVSTLPVDSVALKLRVDPGVEASGNDVETTTGLLSEVKLSRDTLVDDKDAENSVVDKKKGASGVAVNVAFVSTEELIVAVEDTLVGDNVFGGSVTLVVVAVIEELNSVTDA